MNVANCNVGSSVTLLQSSLRRSLKDITCVIIYVLKEVFELAVFMVFSLHLRRVAAIPVHAYSKVDLSRTSVFSKRL